MQSRVVRDLSVVEREVTIKNDGPTFLMRMRPYRTVDNVIDGVVMTFVDISDRRHAEDLQSHMIDELNHRVKNTLASVQVIVSQSLQGIVDEELQRILQARLLSLSQTHNLLAQKSWSRVSLRELLSQQLEPYRSNADTQFSIEGPDLDLNSNASLALGLAFHELTTNAVKYGALSLIGGQVQIRWSIVHSNGALRLVWKESGGPACKGAREQRLWIRCHQTWPGV